jgi:hypothetical protein
MFRLLCVITLSVLLVPAAISAEPSGLEVFPERLDLTSSRQPCRVLVTSRGSDGKRFDATGMATITSVDPAVATIDNGRVVATGPGSTHIRVESGSDSTTVPVTVTLGRDVPVSLQNEVLPVLSKQGCSSGACHGSPNGKGGFRLSLRAFDLDLDELTLRSEFFARRINPVDPDTSILLRKPLTEVPHAGGRRLETGSIEHSILRTWIGEGARLDEDNAPRCEAIQLYPSSGRELSRHHPTQRYVVLATFSDQSVRDVTDLAVFTTSNSSIAEFGDAGRVERVEGSRGQAAITVRYLEHMETSFIVSVPDVAGFAWSNPHEVNYVDEMVNQKLKQLQFVPASRCSDSEFIRRVSLDVTGLLPTVEATGKFLADQSETKRSQLIDRLLESPEHAKFMALKWGDALRIKATNVSSPGVFKYHRWLVRAFEQNVPYDDFARQLLTSTGSTLESPPANYFRTAATTRDTTESTAQVFLGARLECARCHNHPHERWTQDNYYGLGSFFHRVQRDNTNRANEQFISVGTQGEVTQPRTGQTMKPWLPGTGEIEIAADLDRRHVFADWLTDVANPYFARVEANRLWSQMMGRGIVEPIDDFRDSNPPSNAELLNALADDFASHGFDRRHLLRVILNSETYQRSSESQPGNEDDDRYFSHYPRRLLSAEQLLDAICDVTQVEERFGSLPAGTRATQLPSPDFGKEFLTVFGQPERKSVCRCERSADLNLTQALQIANGTFLDGRLTNGNNRTRRLLKENVPLRAIVEDCYLAAMSRTPTDDEFSRFQQFVERRADSSIEVALEDLLWALLNSNEFLFQH